MTIRRAINVAAANEDYMCFEEAVGNAPEGMFNQSRAIKYEVGEACDDFLRAMTIRGLATCNGDGIREIEVMMFDMIRRENPTSEIEQAIGLGRVLRDAPNDRLALHGSKQDIIARLVRDRDFLNEMKATRHGYSVQEQADGTHAVFIGQGFVRGDFHERWQALSFARDLADEAEEATA